MRAVVLFRGVLFHFLQYVLSYVRSFAISSSGERRRSHDVFINSGDSHAIPCAGMGVFNNSEYCYCSKV